MDEIVTHAEDCGAVLVADECRATGAGIADAVISGLVERGYTGRMRTVRSADCYIPSACRRRGAALDEDEIVRGVKGVLSMSRAVVLCPGRGPTPRPPSDPWTPTTSSCGSPSSAGETSGSSRSWPWTRRIASNPRGTCDRRTCRP